MTTPPRMLIVEDEIIVARDLEQHLKALGYTVVGMASEGEEAVRLAGELRPDLVLMDIRLRGAMDGITAADQIRTRFLLPTVYLTAHADDATVRRARVTEPFGYILKPFEDRELRTVIEMALYKHAAERRLRESERRYATTLSSIGDAVISTDAAGRITFINPVAEALTGWHAVEAVGRPLDEVFRTLDETTRQPAIAFAGSSRQSGTRDLSPAMRSCLVVTRSGREIPVEECAAPICNEHESSSGVVVVFRDVTQRRRMEEQLLQAQKMEAIGQLAGGVAHDFNNALTAINLGANMLLKSIPRDHPWQSLLEEIAKSGDRAADLTRQLLAFSRKQMLQPKVVDLNQLVPSMEKLLRRLLPDSITLSTILDPELYRVKVDPGQMEQVLLNLAMNAKDAMAAGGLLRISTANELAPSISGEQNGKVAGDARSKSELVDVKPGPYVRLSVEDTGHGMDAATRKRIFEPFFTTKEFGKGSGLGLATVHGIVQQSGGAIEVESEPGRGTTFHIYLPALAESKTPGSPPAPADMRTARETVLLVEEEETVRKLTSTILRQQGYTILEAGRAVDALETLGQYAGQVHLLVTDLVMARMSGDALADLVAHERPGVRVLFLTGYGDLPGAAAGSVVASTAGQRRGLLAKPFSPDALARKVRELLDQKAE